MLQRVHRARDRADNAVSLANRLSRYVAPTVFAAIRPNRLDNLATTSIELKVFFSDIEGFTELTERLPVGLVTRLLNEHLDLVNAMADKHGGTVDKFMGDGVLIFFDDIATGAPRAKHAPASAWRPKCARNWRSCAMSGAMREQGSICTCAWASIQASAGSETSARRRAWTTP